MSDAGAELIRTQALAAINDSIAGRLDAEKIELSADGHFVLHNVKLYSPEGDIVGIIERVEGYVDVTALANNRVQLYQLKVQRPVLTLKQDERGLNLVRVFESKTASPEGEPSSLEVAMAGLTLADGEIDFEGAGQRVKLREVSMSGGARVKVEPLELGGKVELSARMKEPLDEALTVSLHASKENGPQRYDVDASLGGSKLRGALELPASKLTVLELVASPREVRAFVPDYPLKVNVYAKGTVSPQSAALKLTAGRAEVDVTGVFDLDRNTAESFRVKGAGADLKELLGAELSSDLSFAAEGSLTDTRPDSLSGDIKLSALWKDKGATLATLEVTGKADKGVLQVGRADVRTPGAELVLRGRASAKQLDLSGTLTAKDLSQVDGTLKRFAGVDTGGLKGNGQLAVTVKGAPKNAAIKAVGELKQLRVAGVELESLFIDADVPDISNVRHTDILLRAKKLRYGEQQLEEVTFDFYTYPGREFDLDLTIKGLGDLALNVRGVLDKDSEGARVNTATLTYPQSKWNLSLPTYVAWRDGVKVDTFRFHDGTQRLEGRAEVTAKKLDARVSLEALDLGRLPAVLAPPSLGLAGLFKLEVSATGSTKHPDVALSGALQNGAVYGVDGIALNLSGTYRKDRADGTLAVASSIGTLSGNFDVPVLALLKEQPDVMQLKLRLDNVPLSQVKEKLSLELPADGLVSAALEVSGPANAPKLSLEVESPELVITDKTVRQARLRVETKDDGSLTAQLNAQALRGRHRVTVTTPLTIASLRKTPPTRDSLLKTPITIDLALEEFSPLAREGGGRKSQRRGGSMSVTGTLIGPITAPQGDVKLTLDKLVLAPLSEISGETVLSSRASEVTVISRSSVAGKPVVAVDAAVFVPVTRFLEPLLNEANGLDAAVTALETSRVKLSAVLSPVQLSQALTLESDEIPPGGEVTAFVELSGTPDAAKLYIAASVNDFGYDKVKLTSARMTVQGNSQQQKLELAIGGKGKDDFRATGTLGFDARLASLKKEVVWKTAPVDLKLTARTFDLAFLSGLTDAVRVVQGRLNMNGRVEGTLGAPRFTGDAQLENGRVALAGNGDFRRIAFDVHATNELFQLKKLEAHSGAGSAQLSARAEKQTAGTWSLKSTGEATKFPIVNDDQLLALATLQYSLDGELTSKLADIKHLTLPAVTVELPEIKRKDLQDLQRPKDIVVIRPGERRRKKITTTQTSAEPGFALRAVLVAPENLFVRSSDVEVELGLSEGFTVEYQNEAKLRGEARIIEGKVAVIGREFTVQKGSEVRFSGAAAQPYINVSALHVNQREDVKITVTVAGRGTDVTIKPTSEPPMPESDIYAILATGRRSLHHGGGHTITPGQAASVVGQLAASQLKSVISRKVPLDVLNFETSDEFRNVKLDVGWYLTDFMYLGGTMNIGANRDRGESVWGGRLEFQMTRTLSLETYAGDAPNYGADVMFTRDF